MIRKLLLIVVCLVSVLSTLRAQEIKVSGISVLPTDLEARTRPRKDLNGDNCALLKVIIPLDGIIFSGNIVGDVAHEGSIYLVYVPEGTRKITVNHSEYYPLDIDFRQEGIAIERNVTYKVVLQRTDAVLPRPSASTDWQFLVISVTPSNASVELDDDVLAVTEGIAQKLVPVGTSHHYRVSAPGMVTQEGDVVVDDADSRKTISVTLKSRMVDVEVTVPEESEIWINGERKSSGGSWKGALNAGSHLMEARMGGRVIASEVHEVSMTGSVQQIQLEVHYGSISISTNVLDARVTLDGNAAGATPLLLKKVLPGVHRIAVSKDGYLPVEREVEVSDYKNTDVTVNLEPEPKPEKTFVTSEPQRQPEPERKEAPGKVEASAATGGRLNVFILGNVGFAPAAGDISYGAMAGVVTRKIGAYGKFRSNFAGGAEAYSTSSGGEIEAGSTIWTNGSAKVSRMTVTGGAMMRVGTMLLPYAGVGYGSRNRLWQDADGNWARVSDYSCSGMAVEAGIALRLGPAMLSVGVNTTAFKYVDVELGIGITF